MGASGQFNWTRQLASNASAVNPMIDHSTLTGDSYYMLAEGNARNVNDRALLLTPIQDKTSGSCLHFWYFQRGQTQQLRLNVYSSASGPILWTQSGSLSSQWTYAQVSIQSPSQSWQGVFEAYALGSNVDASIALDDVTITRGLCPNPGDCNFEVDLCGWSNDKNDIEMDWIVGQGIHSFGTGPQYGTARIFYFFHD